MNRRALRLLSLLPCLALLAPGLPARAAGSPVALRNPGFEEGAAGQDPPGWELTERAKGAGYTLSLTEERPAEGRRAAVLSPVPGPTQPFARGSLRQGLDAAAFRGKRVRLRASVRAEGGGTAQIWIGADRPGAAAGVVDALSDVAASTDWTAAEVISDVSGNAEKVRFGLQLTGPGRAFLDGVSFEAVGEAGAGNEPPHPLSARGLDNLMAFTRLLGLVRFFHPSDQAAAADWNKLALAGVPRAERAKDAGELARTLEEIFRPLAPTLRVAAGGKPALAPELVAPAGAVEVTAWEHQGVKLEKPPVIYRSERFSFKPGAPPPGGLALQWVDAEPLRGKKVRLTAAVRGEAAGARIGRLSLAAVRVLPGTFEPKRLAGAGAATNADADVGSDWRTVSVEVTVPEEATALEIGLGLAAGGRVFWDDVALAVDGADKPAALPAPRNPGFEEPPHPAANAPEGWQLQRESLRAGYGTVDCPAPRAGSRCFGLAFTAPPAAELPHPDAPLLVDLGGGVTALVPLALYRDAGGTLPRVASEVRPPSPEKPEAFLLSGNDRATRLADVALAWTIFEHFYPYFDVVGTDWNAELPRALAAAATDADELAFLSTLRKMVAALHDGHGGVYSPREVATHGLPLVWSWIEEQLVITRLAPSGTEGAAGLAAGDVVLTIDGRPAAEVVAAREAEESGATPQWRRYRTVGDLLWGAEGQEVRLTVRHPDGRTEAVTLRRTLPRSATFDEARPEKIAEVRPGIFYVDIDRIDDNDFKGALDRLATAKGIVFDLRGYPGHLTTIVLAHLTDVPVSTARWHVPLVTVPDHPGLRFDFSNWSVEPEKPRLTAKIAFLIDGRAISYAETYLGIVENYHLAALVGTPTAGTNGNINPFTLPGSYSVYWTGMRVLKHDGSRHHGVGILPTVPVTRTIQGVLAGRDEILEKGIEVVSPSPAVTAAAGSS